MHCLNDQMRTYCKMHQLRQVTKGQRQKYYCAVKFACVCYTHASHFLYIQMKLLFNSWSKELCLKSNTNETNMTVIVSDCLLVHF